MPDREKPIVTVPEGEPSRDLAIEILGQGAGAEAVNGSTLSVHYVGVSWSTKAEFDSSWSRNQPFGLTLGKGEVIAGWDRGLLGMKVGERRRIVIPPHLGYGSTGAGLLIRPNETLIFVVDLLAIDEGEQPRKRSTFRRILGGR